MKRWREREKEKKYFEEVQMNVSTQVCFGFDGVVIWANKQHSWESQSNPQVQRRSTFLLLPIVIVKADSR